MPFVSVMTPDLLLNMFFLFKWLSYCLNIDKGFFFLEGDSYSSVGVSLSEELLLSSFFSMAGRTPEMYLFILRDTESQSLRNLLMNFYSTFW
jgi:hypothetical protein